MIPQLAFRPLLLACAVSSILLTGCSGDDAQELNTQHLTRAEAYNDQGQYKAAIIEYRNAVKTSEGKVDSLLAYADMLNDIGRYGSALELLKQAPEPIGEAVKFERVESYIGLSKFRSAAKALAEVSDKESDAHRFYLASVRLGKGDLDAARQGFTEVSKQAPADSQYADLSHLRLAQMQANQQQYAQANELLSFINANSDVYPESQVVKAGIQIMQDDLEGAEATLSDVLSLMPNTDIMEPARAVVLERLAYVLTRLGRSNEAYIYQKLLAEAFPGANEVQEKYEQAYRAFESKDLAQAKTILSSVVSEYPRHTRSKQLLGVIAYLEGDSQSASNYLEQSVDPEVADPLTRNIYAATSLKLNDPNKVLEILGPEAGDSDSVQTLSLFGMASVSVGRTEQGEAALKKAAKLAPKNVPVRLALASHYRAQAQKGLEGASQEELLALEQAYVLAPSNRQVLTELVSYKLRNDGEGSARQFLAKNLKAQPNDFAANLVAGYLALSSDRLNEAEAYFEKALNAQGAAKNEALFALGRTQLGLENTAGAEQSFRSLIEIEPNSYQAYQGLYLAARQQDEQAARKALESFAQQHKALEPYYVLIRGAVASRDYNAAEAYLQRASLLETDAIQLNDMEQSIQVARAQDALAQGNHAEARAVISGLLSRAPDDIRLLSMLVDIELRDQQLGEASKVLGQIERVNESHPLLPLLRGELAFAKQDLAQARKHYEAIWRDSANARVAEKLFLVLGLMNDDAAQLEHLDTWLARIPDSGKALLLRAIKHQESAQLKEAAALYERLLKVAPNNIAALNNLGWLYFEVGDKRSIATLERAVELAPENPNVLDSLGWVLFKSGRVQEGRLHLQKAVSLAPDSKEIAKHYAQAKAN